MPHGTTVNQLPNNDGMVDSVKRLAKVKEAGSQIATRIIKLREPVVDEIEQTVSGGRSFKTTKLATINMLADIFDHPRDHKIFQDLRQNRG